MYENEQRYTGHDGPLADQPKPPADGAGCTEYPEPDVPTVEDPKACPEPDKRCECPQKPGETSTCLEKLIAEQAAEIVAAENADAFKKILDDLLKSAKLATQKYTRDKYQNLVDTWVEQDKQIVELIHTIVCKYSCWRCIIDCHVCPLLYQIHDAEQRLNDDGELYKEVHDLQDLQYWHTRNKAAMERRFERIKKVLGAWETPEATIRDALDKNAELIKKANGTFGTEPGNVIYDVFLRIVPIHLAIAPPQGSKWTTKIEKRFTGFCECRTPEPDDCCGPNIGEGSLVDRLIGPLPYLIDPNDYFKLICCLVEKRYWPAQKLLKDAATALANVQSKIATYEGVLKDWRKEFENNAKATIPSVIKCSDYTPKGQSTQYPSQAE